VGGGEGEEDPLENILLIFFFVQLSKRETYPHNACLPLPNMQDTPN
jgi:hypothetical protein